jgi:hypothetical protein
VILLLLRNPEPVTISVEPGRTDAGDSVRLAVVDAGTMGCTILNNAELVLPEASVADIL